MECQQRKYWIQARFAFKLTALLVFFNTEAVTVKHFWCKHIIIYWSAVRIIFFLCDHELRIINYLVNMFEELAWKSIAWRLDETDGEKQNRTRSYWVRSETTITVRGRFTYFPVGSGRVHAVRTSLLRKEKRKQIARCIIR